jgi:hypothetical protein
MLGPPNGVYDRSDLLRVSVFANRREEISSLQEIRFFDAGDPGDHFRRVPRVVLLEQLESAPRVLKGQIICDIGW